MEWQPINTAPKGYKPILLKQDDAIGEGHYATHINSWEFFNPSWVMRRKPTHWMHLPDAFVEPIALLNGGNCDVPKNIAVCPECGSKLSAESNEWDEKTGKPSKGGLLLICENYDENHRGYQSDWQIVHHHVEDWCGAVDV